jgi:hypothetical protein
VDPELDRARAVERLLARRARTELGARDRQHRDARRGHRGRNPAAQVVAEARGRQLARARRAALLRHVDEHRLLLQAQHRVDHLAPELVGDRHAGVRGGAQAQHRVLRVRQVRPAGHALPAGEAVVVGLLGVAPLALALPLEQVRRAELDLRAVARLERRLPGHQREAGRVGLLRHVLLEELEAARDRGVIEAQAGAQQRVDAQRGLPGQEAALVAGPRAVALLLAQEVADAALDRGVDRARQVGRGRRCLRCQQLAVDREAEELEPPAAGREAEAADRLRADRALEHQRLVEDHAQLLAAARELDLEGAARRPGLGSLRKQRLLVAEERALGEGLAVWAVDAEAARAEQDRRALALPLGQLDARAQHEVALAELARAEQLVRLAAALEPALLEPPGARAEDDLFDAPAVEQRELPRPRRGTGQRQREDDGQHAASQCEKAESGIGSGFSPILFQVSASAAPPVRLNQRTSNACGPASSAATPDLGVGPCSPSWSTTSRPSIQSCEPSSLSSVKLQVSLAGTSTKPL